MFSGCYSGSASPRGRVGQIVPYAKKARPHLWGRASSLRYGGVPTARLEPARQVARGRHLLRCGAGHLGDRAGHVALPHIPQPLGRVVVYLRRVALPVGPVAQGLLEGRDALGKHLANLVTHHHFCDCWYRALRFWCWLNSDDYLILRVRLAVLLSVSAFDWHSGNIKLNGPISLLIVAVRSHGRI